MNRQELESIVLSVPEVAGWPELADLFVQVLNHPRQDWELPLIATRALGGDEAVVGLAATALILTQISITLVDDILDQDPRGAHHRLGEGAVANIALALQAIAFRLVQETPVDAERRAAVSASLAQMALATAYGQNLDVQNGQGEENYWKVVRAKSTPFYGTALHIGALLANAPVEVADPVRELGRLNGEIIQIYDDLGDALQKPANPDWKRPHNNLALLYTLTAKHPRRDEFSALLPQVERIESLQAAQQILLESGAVSYCAYHVVKRYQAARRIVENLPLVDPEPLRSLVAHQIGPVLGLLKQVGASIPAELEAI